MKKRVRMFGGKKQKNLKQKIIYQKNKIIQKIILLIIY